MASAARRTSPCGVRSSASDAVFGRRVLGRLVLVEVVTPNNQLHLTAAASREIEDSSLTGRRSR